jgi:hypothetical protein
MSGSDNTKDQHGSQENPSADEPAAGGHTGEGAASAMAQLISQGQQHRRHGGEADDAAGSQHS